MAIIPWNPRLSYLFGSGGPDDNGTIYTLTDNGMRGGPEYGGINVNSDFTWTAGSGDKTRAFQEVTVTEDGRMFGILKTLDKMAANDSNSGPKFYEIINDDVTGISVNPLNIPALGDGFPTDNWHDSITAHPDGSLYVTQMHIQTHKWHDETYTSKDPGLAKLSENDDGSWSLQKVEYLPEEYGVFITDMQFISKTQVLYIKDYDPPWHVYHLELGTLDENGNLLSAETVIEDTDVRFYFTVDQDANGNLVIHNFGPTYTEEQALILGKIRPDRDYDEKFSGYRVTDLTLENSRFVDGKLVWDKVTEGETRIQGGYDDPDGSGTEYNFEGGVSNGAFAPICFASGTLIETEDGPIAVENLRKGMMLRTLDNGFQPIRWISGQAFSSSQLAKTQSLRPISIKAGVLGNNTPTRDLVVSRHHRILIRSKIAQRMFSSDEVLVAAKQLLEIDGIDIVEDDSGVEYFHFMFDQHEIIFANGTAAESLFAGPEALKTIGQAACEEILTIFPELRDGVQKPPIRRLIDGKLGRKLVIRHRKNSVALAGVSSGGH